MNKDGCSTDGFHLFPFLHASLSLVKHHARRHLPFKTTPDVLDSFEIISFHSGDHHFIGANEDKDSQKKEEERKVCKLH